MDVYKVLIAIVAITVLMVTLIVFILVREISIKQKRNIDLLYQKYIEFKPEVKSLIELANAYWNLEKKLGDYENELSDNNVRRLKSSIRKIKSYLDESDIEVNDYSGRQFNEGMNVEIVGRKVDKKVKTSIIDEVMSPAILYRGELVQKTKVIITVRKEK